MEITLPAEVRKVQRFSRFARPACMLVLAYLVLGCALLFFTVVFGPTSGQNRIAFGFFSIHGDQFTTPGIKAFALVYLGILFLPIFKMLFHVYALFGNLKAGLIHVRQNVRHLKQLGILGLIMPLLFGVLSLAAVGLLEAGLIPEAAVTRETMAIVPGVLFAFAAPALLLLAAWIMELGIQAKEDADELRRDAELVI